MWYRNDRQIIGFNDSHQDVFKMDPWYHRPPALASIKRFHEYIQDTL